MRTRAGIATAALLLAAGPAAAQVTVSVNGVYDATSVDWNQTRNFTAFVEPAVYAAALAAGASAGFDAGIQLSVLRSGIGVSVSFSRVSRDAAGRLQATIPHPLYFDRDRSDSVDLAGFGYTEQATHLGLGWQGGTGAVGIAVFGGASLFRVRVDTYDTVDFDQSFPFDEVSLRAPRPAERSSSPTGFHVGGRLDWRIGRRVGIGAQLRFSAATASFALPTGESFDIDAGGLQAGAGLRLYF